jgi:hypothetical protein
MKINQKKMQFSVYWFFVIFLMFVITTNVFIIAVKANGVVEGGTQVGGIITSVSASGCQYPPPTGSGPDAVCSAVGCTPNPAVNGVMITPYGYSATGICPTAAMMTTNGTISTASVGMQILGMFMGMVTPGPSIQYGPIGMSL